MSSSKPNHTQLVEELISLQDLSTQKVLEYFFKTGKGEYGEGDRFLGIKVPVVRAAIKPYAQIISPSDVEHLVNSEYHEIRLAGLLLWVNQYKKTKDEGVKKEIVDLFLKNTKHINSWDLVDLSCQYILGEYLLNKPTDLLFELSKSENMWEQRISIISTLTFIRKGQFDTTFALCEHFLDHKHDLIHKATGWCLREIGKRDKPKLKLFLERYAHVMPRTMLRYSLEKMNELDRKHFMEAKNRANR